ncbi:MAG: RagB/SusD family nutrient uptake outer membrane protein [Rikenellaceae bacterium]
MKFKTSKILIGAMMISSMLFTSCEEYLTEANPNKVTTDSFWNDLTDTQTGIYAVFSAFRDYDILSIRCDSWRSDVCWPGYGRPYTSSNDAGWLWHTMQYKYDNAYINSKWEASYTVIWRTNQVIEALEALEGEDGIDEEEWTTQMATVRYMRGLVYFFLYSAFNEGSVILNSHTAENFDDFYQDLAPAEDIFNFFREDLEYAYANLPDVASYPQLPSKAAAATTLGTSCMYEHDYDRAKELFADVIYNDVYGLSLEQDLSKIYSKAGEFNSESIFEVSYSSEERTDISVWGNETMCNTLGFLSKGTTGWFPISWVASAYMEEEMDPLVSDNYVNGKLRDVPLRASTLTAMVMDQCTPYYISGNAAESANMAGGALGQWGFGKFKTYTEHDIVEVESLYSGRNVVVHRLSDVILMYAECLLQNGNTQGALDLINQIRMRWGLVLLGSGSEARTYDGINYTSDMVMDQIMHVERPLELNCEGHEIRWQDLKRWGLLEDDSNNIFKKRAAETFYAITPSVLTKLDGVTPLDDASYTKFNTVHTLEWLQANGYDIDPDNLDTDNYLEINYEFDLSSSNYNSASHKYMPIPMEELTNNPLITQ